MTIAGGLENADPHMESNNVTNNHGNPEPTPPEISD